MSAQHTPGPWTVRRAVTPDNTGGFDCAIVVDGDKIIAEAFQNVGYGDRGGYDERPVAANARLIAAAPDLLAALQRISKNEAEVFDDELQTMVCVAMDAEEMADIARAAITKASEATTHDD